MTLFGTVSASPVTELLIVKSQDRAASHCHTRFVAKMYQNAPHQVFNSNFRIFLEW